MQTQQQKNDTSTKLQRIKLRIKITYNVHTATKRRDKITTPMGG